MTNIAILAYEGCLASEVTGLSDVLHLANRLWTSEHKNARKAPFSCRVLSTQAHPVKTASDVALGAARVRRPRCDLLVVPGVDLVAARGALGHLKVLRAELEVVRETHCRGVAVAAIGSGSLLLAEAGVLNGHRATSAWPLAGVLAKRYPAVEWDPNATITEDNGALSACALSGVYDLGVRIIERYNGTALAQAVSQLILPKPSQHTQAFDAYRTNIQGTDPLALKVQRWLRQHFRKQVRITEVARRFGVTTRKLRRLFQAATGDTLIAYLQKLRVEHAKTLLATPRLPMPEVVRRSGYVNASVFGELFRRYATVTPTEYRKSVARSSRASA